MKIFKVLPREEKANTLTHALGLAAIIFLSPMLIYNLTGGDQWLLMGVLTFCFGALFMFFSSTIYHLVSDQSKKNVWRVIDHIAIFFLIGGTYTVFILKYYNTAEGLKFLLLHWLIILAGIIFKIFFTGKYEIVSTLLYVCLGWMVIFIFDPITNAMPSEVLQWLIIGGICYTIGVFFYIWDKLPFNHSIWHIFVIGGCFGHFTAIYHF